MSYSMRRSFGEEPITCADGFVVAANPTGGQRCVPNPNLTSEEICQSDINQSYRGSDDSCLCNTGYTRDPVTMKCGQASASCPEHAHMVSRDLINNSVECECDSGYQMDDYGKCYPVESKAASSIPTWTLVLGGAAAGLFFLGVALRG